MATPAPKKASLAVTSTAFTPGGRIPAVHTCDGIDQSPPLRVDGFPPEAKAWAIICEDPDAPGQPNPFIHWTVWNLPVSKTTLAFGEDVVKSGALQGENDFGETRYRGPCPPPGTHRYYFRVYALHQKLDLADGASIHALRSALKARAVATGELMGTYSRTR